MELLIRTKNHLLESWGRGPLYRAIMIWCLGLFMITFDRILFFEIQGMTIKSFYFVFLVSNIFLIQHFVPTNYLQKVVRAALALPWIFLVLQLILLLPHSAIVSLHKFKSFVYTGWLWFDFLMIALPVYLFRGEELASTTGRANIDPGRTFKAFIFPTLAACIAFLSFVVIVDYLAFFFGILHGLLGFSQYNGDYYNWPRPSAFSLEPSYIAMFFALGITWVFSEFLTNKELSRGRKYYLLAVTVIAGISLIMFFSRSGLAFWVLLFTASYFVFVRQKVIHIKMVLVHFGIFISMLIAFFALLPKKEFQKINHKLIAPLASGTDASMLTRLTGFHEAYELIQQNAGMSIGAGVGMGNSYAVSRLKSLDALEIKDFGKQNIQNIWLEVLSEQGFVLTGLFALFILTFAIFLVTGKRYSEFTTQQQIAGISFVLFFLCEAHFLPNVCRSDMWVWIGIWAYFLPQPAKTLGGIKSARTSGSD